MAQRGIFGQIEFSLALGTLCARTAALVASYHKGQQVLAERLMEGTGRMLEGEPGRSGLLEMDFQSRYTIAIAPCCRGHEPGRGGCRCGFAFKDALAVPGARGWELQTLVGVVGIAFMARLTRLVPSRFWVVSGTMRLVQHRGRAVRVPAAFAAGADGADRTTPALTGTLSPFAMPSCISAKFARPITLEEVSAAIGFSVNYFSTLFKKETGEGFAKYLARVRMDEARAMLRETAQPVAEICRSVGYGDLKHFTHSFKAETGLTPGEYRKLYG